MTATDLPVHKCACGTPIQNPHLSQCSRCWREDHDADLDRRDDQRAAAREEDDDADGI